MIIRLLLIAIIGLTTTLTGCQTMRPVTLANNESLTAKFAPKDRVLVWMHDGRSFDLILTAVEADALVSKEQRIPLKEIERIERSDINWTRTTLLLVGIGAVVLLGFAINASHNICVYGCK